MSLTKTESPDGVGGEYPDGYAEGMETTYQPWEPTDADLEAMWAQEQKRQEGENGQT